MKITDVRIRKINSDSKLKAVASITFDDVFVCHEIKVIEGEKLFIAMPSRKGSDNEYHDICHPINKEFRAELEKAVLDAYKAE